MSSFSLGLLDPPEPLFLGELGNGKDHMEVDGEAVDWENADDDDAAKAALQLGGLPIAEPEADGTSGGGGRAEHKAVGTKKIASKDAADKVARLSQEIKRLRGELEQARITVGVAQAMETAARNEMAQLRDKMCALEVQLGVMSAERSRVEDALKDRDATLARVRDERADMVAQRDGLRQEVKWLRGEIDDGGHRRKRSKKDEESITADESSMDYRSGESAQVSTGRSSDLPQSFEGMTVEEQRARAIEERERQLPPPLTTRWPKFYDEPTLDSMKYDVPPAPPPRQAVDSRGYPTDQFSWERMLLLSRDNHLWVYSFRVFAIYAFALLLEPEQRNEVHKIALVDYRMTDWMANTLTAIAKDKAGQDALWNTYDRMNYSTVVWDPVTFAGWIQFREKGVRGCQFKDDCFTLYWPEVRGANLFAVISVNREDPCPKLGRLNIEKLLIRILATPGQYETAVRDNDWMIADELRPRSWNPDTALTATIEEVMEEMTIMGIDVDRVNDCYPFAHEWLKTVADGSAPATGWSAEEAGLMRNNALNAGSAPPPFHDDEPLFPRHPALPFIATGDRLVQTELSHWAHPLLKDMKREDGSQIGARMARTVRMRSLPYFNRNHWIKHNPWSVERQAVREDRKTSNKRAGNRGGARGGVRGRGGHPYSSAPDKGKSREVMAITPPLKFAVPAFNPSPALTTGSRSRRTVGPPNEAGPSGYIGASSAPLVFAPLSPEAFAASARASLTGASTSSSGIAPTVSLPTSGRTSSSNSSVPATNGSGLFGNNPAQASGSTSQSVPASSSPSGDGAATRPKSPDGTGLDYGSADVPMAD
ncbi:hypothetical protein C8R44DRAFT_741541 [Mycena epipterygia]|nr:hypothetical protein C8R44DRAFT_741541 [Mycena epipterygia]